MAKSSEVKYKGPSDQGRVALLLNAAAPVVSGTRKFDRGLTQLLHADLHWLDVPVRLKVQTLYDDASMPGRHCSTVSGLTLGTSL